MTVMQFDSHRGWCNPSPDLTSRPYRADAPLRSDRYGAQRSQPVEKQSFYELLEKARSGDKAAEAELRARNGNMSR